MKVEFIESDLLDGQSKLVATLAESVDIVYAALVFHHFTWEQQLEVARRLVGLLQSRLGSMVVGRIVAYRDRTGAPERASIQGLTPFSHDLDSWKKLWAMVQEGLEDQYELETWEQTDRWFEERPAWRDISYYLCFSFRRVR